MKLYFFFFSLYLLSEIKVFAIEEILKPGRNAKAMALNGQLSETTSAAVFYNPAILTGSSGLTVDAELNLTSLNYRYEENGDFADASLNSIITPVFLGVRYQTNTLGTFSGFILPRGAFKRVRVNNLPLTVDQQQISLDAVQYNRSLRFGGSYSIAWHPKLRLGLGVSFDLDQEQVELFGDQDAPTLILDHSGLFWGYHFGLAYQLLPKLHLGLSYHSELNKDFRSRTRLIGGLADEELNAYHFLPAQFNASLKAQLSRVEAFLEYSFRAYAEGRNKRRTGLSVFDGRERNLQNTQDIGFALKGQLEDFLISAGYRFEEGAVGPGSFLPSGDLDTSGIQMGADLDYLDRHRFSVGCQYFEIPQLQLSLSLTEGRHMVDQTRPAGGSYKLSIINLGISYSSKL